MRKIKLDEEERTLVAAMDRDEFVPVTGKELNDIANAIAARKKDMTLTIRVNHHDIHRIKKLAKTKGIPYQSYLSEVIHRVAFAV